MQSEEPAETPEEPAAATPVATTCEQIGLADKRMLEAFGEQLGDIRYTTMERTQSITLGKRILTGPYDDLADAEQVASDLRADGFNDLVVYAREQYANQISVGTNLKQSYLDRQLQPVGCRLRSLYRRDHPQPLRPLAATASAPKTSRSSRGN